MSAGLIDSPWMIGTFGKIEFLSSSLLCAYLAC